MTDIVTPDVALHDNHKIPQVGLGLWQVRDQAQFNGAFEAAVLAGYRHFDTAQIYGNEQYLGEALQQSGLKRQEVWITTKIAAPHHFGHDRLLKSFEVSLKNLQTDYVNLLLLHFPIPLLRKKSWLSLQELQVDGKARSIGVSNYTIRHLKEMKKYAKIAPAVNQVELHVFLQQPDLLKYCQDQGIIVEAYSPIAHAREMSHPLILEIAHKHQKSYAQIMLRWCLQKELVILPKSVSPERIQQNIDIFDFVLDDNDMLQLAGLDRNLRTCWDPTLVP